MRLVVIGGGPGGYVAAIRGAQLGGEVVLVEQARLGGVCLNAGCIPTKALLHTAELYAQAGHGEAFGVLCEPALDFSRAQARKAAVVDRLVDGVQGLMAANNIRVVQGTARLVDNRSVRVGDQLLPADRIIIATGSVPALPPIPGADGPRCLDSTGALALDHVPASLVIIGGGVIGVEMATIYATLGSAVTVVELLEEILPGADREMAGLVRGRLEALGVSVLTGAGVRAIAHREDRAEVQVGERTIPAEAVLVCVGRRSSTDPAELDAAGIRHDRGRIRVDEGQRTNLPGVYAIGDCTGGAMLAHVASAQGEVAAENALGRAAVYDGKTVPACVYTRPELAGVGLTEEQAAARGEEFVVGRFPLAANGKSLLMGEDGLVKVIAGKRYGELWGVHMVGPRATDLIAEAALAIGAECTLDEIIHTIHAHPTVGEAVREAALAAQDRAIHTGNRGQSARRAQ